MGWWGLGLILRRLWISGARLVAGLANRVVTPVVGVLVDWIGRVRWLTVELACL